MVPEKKMSASEYLKIQEANWKAYEVARHNPDKQKQILVKMVDDEKKYMSPSLMSIVEIVISGHRFYVSGPVKRDAQDGSILFKRGHPSELTVINSRGITVNIKDLPPDLGERLAHEYNYEVGKRLKNLFGPDYLTRLVARKEEIGMQVDLNRDFEHIPNPEREATGIVERARKIAVLEQPAKEASLQKEEKKEEKSSKSPEKRS